MDKIWLGFDDGSGSSIGLPKMGSKRNKFDGRLIGTMRKKLPSKIVLQFWAV